MNTETTDNNGGEGFVGWVGYDRDCGFCCNLVRRWHGVFEARGFSFVPLQNRWLTGRLGITAMPNEMKLLLVDGRVVGGADAIAAMACAVWYMAPFGWLMKLPGVRALAAAAYRWVAKNRHRLGVCQVPVRLPVHNQHGHTAFFEAP